MLKTEQLESIRRSLTLARQKVAILDQRQVSRRDEQYKYWSDRSNKLLLFETLLLELKCSHNHSGMIGFGKCEMINGEFHIMARCSDCGEQIGQWISKNKVPQDILDNLPIFESYLDYDTPCEVCGEYGVEVHHWAPKELFPQDFEQWPKSYLCPKHHQKWHTTVTTPYRALRRRKDIEDEHGKAA